MKRPISIEKAGFRTYIRKNQQRKESPYRTPKKNNEHFLLYRPTPIGIVKQQTTPEFQITSFLNIFVKHIRVKPRHVASSRGLRKGSEPTRAQKKLTYFRIRVAVVAVTLQAPNSSTIPSKAESTAPKAYNRRMHGLGSPAASPTRTAWKRAWAPLWMKRCSVGWRDSVERNPVD
jgi:hypothetical protein